MSATGTRDARENACHYARWRFTKRPVLPRGKTNEIKGREHKVEIGTTGPAHVGKKNEQPNVRFIAVVRLAKAPFTLFPFQFATFPFSIFGLHYNAQNLPEAKGGGV
jgi:hypothetical protein